MKTGACAALAVLILAFAMIGSSAADPVTLKWRKLTQVEDRYATFLNLPGAAKQGDRYDVRLVVLYRPGAETSSGRSVAWDEYPALTVNCALMKARRGVRVRHAADGAVLSRDEDPDFRLFDGGSNEDDVAKAKCDRQFSGKTFEVKDGPSWMAQARKNMADVVRRAPR